MAAPVPPLSTESVSLPSIHQMFPGVLASRGGSETTERSLRSPPIAPTIPHYPNGTSAYNHQISSQPTPSTSYSISRAHPATPQIDPALSAAAPPQHAGSMRIRSSPLHVDIPQSKPIPASYPPTSSGSEYSSYPLPSPQSTAYTSYPSPPSSASLSVSGDNDPSRRHVCTQCNKRFNRPSSLRIHLNTHTGATPFRCPWPNCNREFNVNSNMRRHYRNHTVSAASTPPITDSVLLTPAPSSTSSPASSSSNSSTSNPSSSFTGPSRKPKDAQLKLQSQSFHPYAVYDHSRLSPFPPSSNSSRSTASVSPQLKEEEGTNLTAIYTPSLPPGLRSAPGNPSVFVPTTYLQVTGPHSAPPSAINYRPELSSNIGLGMSNFIPGQGEGHRNPPRMGSELDTSSGLRSTIS